MHRSLLKLPHLAGVLGFAALLMAACGDDIVIEDPTGTPGVGGVGGVGGTTTTTIGGGGVGATGGGGAGAGGMTGGGGTGGTIIPDTGDDTCPGDPYSLTLGDHLFLGGDTSTAQNDYDHSGCVQNAGTGPERVYAFDFNDYGTLKVQVRGAEGSTLNPTLVWKLENTCEDINDWLICFGFFESQESFAAEVGPGAPAPLDFTALHVMVDGQDESAGEYVMEVSYLPAACGDGVVNKANGETCDDGNTMSNDGCDANCQVETTSLFDKCPGEPVVLFANNPQVLQGGTWGYADDYAHTPNVPAGSCTVPAIAGPDGGRDRIYRVTPAEDGTLTASVGYAADGVTDVCETDGILSPNCWDRVLYVTGPNACDTNNDGVLDGPQLACSDAGPFTPETVSVPVIQGQEYYVIVDSLASFPAYFGAFNLRLELTP